MAHTPGEELGDEDLLPVDADAGVLPEIEEEPQKRTPSAAAGNKPLRRRIEEYLERRRLERALDEALDDDVFR